MRHTTQGASWQTGFAIEIDLGRGLARREMAILFDSARRCQVHKLRKGEMSFDDELCGDTCLSAV